MARPAKYGAPATQAIRIRLTADQRRDLEQVAKQNDTDLTGLIREAVNSYVADCRDGEPAFCSPKLIH